MEKLIGNLSIRRWARGNRSNGELVLVAGRL